MARPSKRRYSVRGPNYSRNVENRKAAVAEANAAEAGVEATAVFRDVLKTAPSGKKHVIQECVGVVDLELLKPDRVHGGIVRYEPALVKGELVLRSEGPNDDEVLSKATNKRAARLTRDYNRR